MSESLSDASKIKKIYTYYLLTSILLNFGPLMLYAVYTSNESMGLACFSMYKNGSVYIQVFQYIHIWNNLIWFCSYILIIILHFFKCKMLTFTEQADPWSETS